MGCGDGGSSTSASMARLSSLGGLTALVVAPIKYNKKVTANAVRKGKLILQKKRTETAEANMYTKPSGRDTGRGQDAGKFLPRLYCGTNEYSFYELLVRETYCNHPAGHFKIQ